MAPLTAWLPACANQDFDLVVKIVGPGASVLLKEWTPIAQFLIGQGMSVMAQSERHNGDVVLHLRLALQPFYSMGHGCDVLVYVGENVPEFWRFSLQPGSVLIWEPPREQRHHSVVPEGVMAYPVPLADLCGPYGEGGAGKGLAALGVLLHLLGCSEESLHRLTPLVAAPRSFAAGVEFAHHELKKRDAYWLPLPTPGGEPGRIMLAPEQAIMLGFAVSSCTCGTACDRELLQLPVEWMAKHLGIGGGMVSPLQSEVHSDVQVFRGPQGRVLALLGGDDRMVASCLNGFNEPKILIASDVEDALKLLIEGHDCIRRGLCDGVGVLIEETVATRHQSIAISSLADMIGRRPLAVFDTGLPGRSDLVGAMVERDRDDRPAMGFVAWGMAQGVVRDAVALCRNFGLNVTALYPKVIVPFPRAELETFARAVQRVTLVELSGGQEYEERLRACCSFPLAVLKPPPGEALTPMDIFQFEGLGTT